MKEDNLLRGLFLAYHAVENKAKKEDALLEIFKFMQNGNYFELFFQPLLAFIIKKGAFSETKVKEMLDNYLTPNQKQSKMIAQLSIADKWEARGEARGKIIGKEIGETIGEKKKAHLMVLRGHFRGQSSDLLADICGLPLNEVLDLEKGYEAIKAAWQEKKVDIAALSKSTMLSEEEVKFVITCLDSAL